MADVFISYARPDAGAARRLADALEGLGFAVWFDRDLPAHRPYADQIAEELEAARAVLVLWSEAATRSQWVRSEADRARERGVLVQARLDRCRLPMPFDQVQCADLAARSAAQRDESWVQVVRSLEAVLGQAASAGPLRAPASGRRAILLGGAAAAVGAAGGGWFLWRSREHRASPGATLLLQKGMDALQANDALDTEGASVGTTAQAIALLTDATDADPDSAEAWGGLAMAYAVRRRAVPPAERAGLDQRARSAAASALALDKAEPRALASLQMLQPVYRNWMAAERRRRETLAIHPTFPIFLFLLSDVLGAVGRFAEARGLSARLDRTKFLIPGADRKALVNEWAAGNLGRADQALAILVDHWPDHPQVWPTRVGYLLYTGRPRDALALLRDPSAIPNGVSPRWIAAASATGRALTGELDAGSALRQVADFARDMPSAALQAAQAVATLGDGDAVFAMLEGYYFGRGEWALLAPPGGDEDRQTLPLFLPPMRGLWRDARFAALVERIGLEDYWRKAGTKPDYRA